MVNITHSTSGVSAYFRTSTRTIFYINKQKQKIWTKTKKQTNKQKQKKQKKKHKKKERERKHFYATTTPDELNIEELMSRCTLYRSTLT